MSLIQWSPDKQRISESSMYAFLGYIKSIQGGNRLSYKELYRWSVSNRELFWQAITDYFNVDFYSEPTCVAGGDSTLLGTQWFPGSTLNYAEHLLRHNTNRPAIIFRCENGRRSELSFAELGRQVASAQLGLAQAGVSKGDRVAAMLPNCPEAIVMMLATTALGAIWSSCSPDFGMQGVIDRFGQIAPKVLIALDGYFYNGKAIDCSVKVQEIESRLQSVDVTVIVPFANSDVEVSGSQKVLYQDFLKTEQASVYFEPVAFDHPLFIMYSSGTTGVPKCIVHGHGGTLLQHLKELGLHTDVKAGDRIFYFTTCGWMMWNWLISSLALGATVVLYDGSPFYPTSDALINLVDEEQINIFGTSAKYIGALEKASVKPVETHNLSSLRTLLSTGSPLTHESFDYVYQDIKSDLCLSSISGGTDIISCFVLGCPLLPVVRGQIQCRGLGMDVQFANASGESVVAEKGELICQSSFPSMPIGFWNDPDDEKYKKAYFSRYAGIWSHGDYGELTEEGGVIIHGRSDAVLNPGGVRIGTAEIYRQVEKVDDILESIAIGQEWENDTRIILFVKLRTGKFLTEALIDHLKSVIRKNTTPRHVPAKVLQVEDIPRTISGKIVELAVREVVNGRPVVNEEALANPEALTYFRGRLELHS